MLEACRAELQSQQALVAGLVEVQLRPALRALGTPIVDVGDLGPSQGDFLARYFVDFVEPILTPLAADAAHPFPFISNLGLNLAVLATEPGRRNHRFVRIKVSPNRPRWVQLPDHAGWVPLRTHGSMYRSDGQKPNGGVDVPQFMQVPVRKLILHGARQAHREDQSP